MAKGRHSYEEDLNMKVLIISPFPPNPAPEATHALYLSEHLAESGLSVHVLCGKGNVTATHKNIVIDPVMDDWSEDGKTIPRQVNPLAACAASSAANSFRGKCWSS